MLARGVSLFRRFSLDSHFLKLREKMKTNLSLEELYKATEDFYADTTILTSDPKAILGHRDTIVELQSKFGLHTKQLISGIVQPLFARASALRDLSYRDAMSLIRLALDLDTLANPLHIKPALKTLTSAIQQREEPLDPRSILDLYRIMRKTRVLSYELVSELETSQLYLKDLNLFAGGTGLLQVYADFNLSLTRVWQLVKEALEKEMPTASETQVMMHMKALVSAEEFSVPLWEDTVLPRLKQLKPHHLSKEAMEDLATVVAALDLLAPPALQQNAFLKSEEYLTLKGQALFSAKHRKELQQYPSAVYQPADPKEKRSFSHSEKMKHPNALTQDIAKVLTTMQEGFTANCVVGSPYSLFVELLLKPNIIIKPVTNEDFVFDSFQLMGTSRLQVKMLRKLNFKVAEISSAEWAMHTKNSSSGQLIRLIKVARGQKP